MDGLVLMKRACLLSRMITVYSVREGVHLSSS